MYEDKTSLFKELLEKDNSVSIHHKNLQAPVTYKMYKISNIMSPITLNSIFATKATPYNLHILVSFKMR